MAAPAKFLFDNDFSAPIARASELDPAEIAERMRPEAARRSAPAEIASTLGIATGIDHAAGALKANRSAARTEAVEVAVAVLAQGSLIERAAAEFPRLGGCFRELVAASHVFGSTRLCAAAR
jgi:hypothetical protein